MVDQIIDTELSLQRKCRALAERVPGADFLMRAAAADLADRLATLQRRFDRAVALHCLTDDAAEAIRVSGKAVSVERVERQADLLGGGPGIVAAGEELPFEPASIDLVVTTLTMHEVNDIPGLLWQIRTALKPDGLFLAALPGGDTLRELNEAMLAAESELTGGASPRVLPFAELRQVGGLLQRAGFALPVVDSDTITVRYGDMFGLMRDLRAMGQTNSLVARSRRPATRRLFMRAAEIYAQRFADPDGRVRATFQLIWMSGWAPDGSQQKPLKPGSARMPLAEALRQAGGE